MILRSCTLADCTLMAAWDPHDEMWVGNKLEWLQARLSDPSHHVYVGYMYANWSVCDPVAWGQIKVERDYCTLAWFVGPDYRRVGFGTQMAQLLATMSARPIRARINANRPYSERIAVRLGMLPESGLLDTGEKWWVRR